MDALIVIGLIWLVYLTISLRLARKNRELAENWFKTIQVICVVGAFGLAAYWYFLERKGHPHANISQTAQAFQLSPGLVAVEVHTTIENLGSRLLRLERARVALQLVSPGSYDYEALWALRGDAYWDAVKPGETLPDGAPNPFFHRGELRWYPIRTYDRPVNHEIEPSESDLLVTTFLVRCNARVVRVATDLEKGLSGIERLFGAQDLSWKARSFVDLGRACTPSEGAGSGDNEGERPNAANATTEGT